MPALAIPNSFSPNTTILSSAVNANFNAVATLLNSTLLDNTNIATGGISTANLADGAVTSAKIPTGGIATTNLADGSVTSVKRAALNSAVSSSSASFTSSSGTLTDVTNLTVTLVTTGRPVYLTLQAGATSSVIGISGSGSPTAEGEVAFLCNSSIIYRPAFQSSNSAGTNTNTLYYPPSTFSFFHVVSAGTQVYKIQVANLGVSGTLDVVNCTLAAYEL